MEEEYVSKIILELQPKSRRGYRRLFGIRENRYLNKELFDTNSFTETFLNQYNRKVLRQGEHIKCENLILAVKQIKCASSKDAGNTQVEYRVKGRPLKKKDENLINEKRIEKQGKLNQSFLGDVLHNRHGNVLIEIEEVYSCYCSECHKSLSDGDFYVKGGHWSKPIICLSCYDHLFTHKCRRCNKSITFNQNCLTSDGLATIRFVENDGLYWHSDCCLCVTCLQSLIGKKFYQDQIYNQLFCLDHIPYQYL